METIHKILRWFRMELPYIPRNIKIGIKNLILWTPILFKDRNWDHVYLYKILQFKLKRMIKYHEKSNMFIGVEREIERMKLCYNLIEHLIEDYYESEYQQYYESNFVFDKSKIINNKVSKNDLSEYFNKYPNHVRRAKYSEAFKGFKNNDISLAIITGHMREQKAKKILFKTLERNIDSWWD